MSHLLWPARTHAGPEQPLRSEMETPWRLSDWPALQAAAGWPGTGSLPNLQGRMLAGSRRHGPSGRLAADGGPMTQCRRPAADSDAAAAAAAAATSRPPGAARARARAPAASIASA